MLGATMMLIYMRDRTMTKRTCDVGSHGGTFRVVPEYCRTGKFVKGNRYYGILQMGEEKRDARPAIVTCTGALSQYQAPPMESEWSPCKQNRV